MSNHSSTAPAYRQIAVGRIVRRCLVGHGIGPHAASNQLGKNLGRVAEQADRNGFAVARRRLDHRQRVVERIGTRVQISGFEALLDTVGLALDSEHRRSGHRCRQRLSAAHAAESGGQDPAAGEVATVVLAPHLRERLVGPLHDALTADVDPGSCGHLPVHHQAFAVEFPKLLPCRPRRDQIRVRDQDPRRIDVGSKHPDRLARLDEQRLVVAQLAEARDDRLVGLPVPCSLADSAIDDEVFGSLGHLGVEIVHQHAQRRLRQPASGRQFGTGGRLDPACSVHRRSFSSCTTSAVAAFSVPGGE